MFRPFVIASLACLPAAAIADTLTGAARVDAVTVYPGQATVTRLVTLDVPAGRHEIIVPDLPEGLDPQGLRLSGPDGVRLGAVTLARDRLPVTPDADSPAVQAARNALAAAKDALRRRDDRIAEIRLRVLAAEDQITFLQNLSQASARDSLSSAAIADVQALAQMVGAETLALRQAAFAAEQEAQAETRLREDDAKAVAAAQQALDALLAPDQDGAVLTFSLEAAAAGRVTVTLDTVEGFAQWTPVYDMRLTTGAAPALAIERSVTVSQQTGQDWQDVTLVLSTARPASQIAPSPVFPAPRRIVPADQVRQPEAAMLRSGAEVMALDAAPVTAVADFSGATVSYAYPSRVTIRNGADDLRLPLDQLEADVRLWAEAVPARDTVAYRMAAFTNDSAEVLLEGQALLFVDGTMTGFSYLPLTAAGAEAELGFGPLDSLVLTRTTPQKSEGETGVFTTTNRLVESAVLTVENLSAQDWQVLLRDTVPYSEQDDLELDVSADPAITRTDPEGQRGIVEWDLQVPAGDTQTVRLDTTLRWPDGYVLR